MNRQNRFAAFFLSILLLPSIISATPLVSMKSNKVVLTAQASGSMITGGEWRLTERLQTDFFSDGHAWIFEQVYVDVDGNSVIESYEDEIVNFFIHADYETYGDNYYATVANAEIYWGEGDPETAAGPLADLIAGSINVQAKVVAKSIFKITGDTPVEFVADVWNHEGNYSNSFGRMELWDLNTGDLVLDLDDRLLDGCYCFAETLLLTNHTYKLLSVTNNQTGGDEEIGVDVFFRGATVTVAEPPGFVIFLAGLIFLAISGGGWLQGGKRRGASPIYTLSAPGLVIKR